MRGRLVGDDVERHAFGEEAGDDVRRVSDERDSTGAMRIEMRGERLLVACNELEATRHEDDDPRALGRPRRRAPGPRFA